MKMKWVKFGVSPSSKMDASVVVLVPRSHCGWLLSRCGVVWCGARLIIKHWLWWGVVCYPLTPSLANGGRKKGHRTFQRIFILRGKFGFFILEIWGKFGKFRTYLEISISNFPRLEVMGKFGWQLKILQAWIKVLNFLFILLSHHLYSYFFNSF